MDRRGEGRRHIVTSGGPDSPDPAEAVDRVIAATCRCEGAKIVDSLTHHVGDLGFAEG
ncbi:RNA polymerase subunit sigma-24, partial [Burkholderia multivorans]